MHKFNKALSVGLAVLMTCSSFSVLASAQSVYKTEGEYKYEDSTGSVSSDFTTNNEPTGKDTTQGMESAYKHALVDDNSTSIDEFLEETEVYATVAPVFGIKMPKTIILSAKGLAEYDIGIKGDLTGTQKLTVKPVDKITNTDTVDFYMAEQNAYVGAKDDIVATVDQTKTTWTWSEIEKDEYTWLTDAGEISAPDISAGSWAGTFDFVINMEAFQATDSSYFALYAPTLNQSLQEDDIETPATWEKVEMNSSNELEETLGNIFDIKMEYGTSYYAAVLLALVGPEEDPAFLAAAQESDAAADAYFNANYLESIKEGVGDTTSTNADELCKNLVGYTAHELADETVIVFCNSLISETKTCRENYNVSLYASLMIMMFGESDEEMITIAQQNDRAALDAYFNETYLPMLKNDPSAPPEVVNMESFNDVFEYIYGFTVDDIVNYEENGVVPISGNVVTQPALPSYYKGSNSSTAFTFTVTEAQDITFGVQAQQNATVGISFDSNPTKKELKSLLGGDYEPENVKYTKNCYPGMTIYTSLGALYVANELSMSNDKTINDLITAAQQGDAVFDEFFNTYVLPNCEVDGATNFTDVWNHYEDSTIDEWLRFCNEGIPPESTGIDFMFSGASGTYSEYTKGSYTKYFEPGTYTAYVSAVKTSDSYSNVIIEIPGTISVTQVESYFAEDIITDPWENFDGDIYLVLSDTYKNNTRSINQLPSEIVLPTELYGYQITGIQSGIFDGHSEIEYLYIPSTYTKVTLGQCQAKEIVIRSDKLDSLPSFNSYVEVVTLPGNAFSELKSGMFANCTNLKSVTNLSKDITTIPSRCFEECKNLKNVNTPNASIIGDYAFKGCINLQKVNTLNITDVGYQSFYNCFNLKSLNLGNIETIDQEAFFNCTSLNIKLPEGIKTIWNKAFYGCSKLQSPLPTTIEQIYVGAFDNCSSLTSIVLPNVIRVDDAFDSCPLITYVNINKEADGYSTGNNGTFDESYKLKTYIGPYSIISKTNNKPHLEYVEFFGKNRMCDISDFESNFKPETSNLEIVLHGFTGMSIGCFENCSSLTSIDFSDSNIDSVNSDAFKNCTNLKSVRMPKHLNEISNGAFCNCSSLEDINLEETNLNRIGSIFYYRYGFSDENIDRENQIYLGSATTYYNNAYDRDSFLYLDKNDGAFENCTSLTEIVLPNTLEDIGVCNFDGCNNLKSITLPASVSSKGQIGCEYLEEINFIPGADSTSFAEPFNVYEYYDSLIGKEREYLERFTIEIESYKTYRTTLVDNKIPFIVNVAPGVTDIGAYTFYDNDMLSGINIADTVSNINHLAFNGCDSAFTVYGKAGSYAEAWANNNGYTFKAI